MLPSAETLNEEFEGIARAIYAAADRPRPAPVTDDTPTTRTHFVYRIDIWTDDGKDILECPTRCLGTVRTAEVASPKQSNETDKQRGKAKQQEANLGQKEAREQKEKKSELSSMGEGSRESSHDLNQKRD